ncbi:MAG: septum formation initiator family protein [Pseudomonadales bacterium]
MSSYRLPSLRRRLLVAGVLLCLALAGLQYRLWIAQGSLTHTASLERKLEVQSQANEKLKQRNDRMRVEISALKQGTAQLEARAREDLGLVKKDETYFMFVDESRPVDAE